MQRWRPDEADAFAYAAQSLDAPDRAERHRALTKANRLLARAGLRWRDVIRAPAKRREHVELCIALLKRGELLTDWEVEFLKGLLAFARLTAKQIDLLNELVLKVRGLDAARAA